MTHKNSPGMRQDLNASGKETVAKRSLESARWRCLNCGQMVFVQAFDDPPDICQFCDDMTTWRLLDDSMM